MLQFLTVQIFKI